MPVELCPWSIAGGAAPVKLYRWSCAGGAVSVKLCRWSCADGALPVELCRWILSSRTETNTLVTKMSVCKIVWNGLPGGGGGTFRYVVWNFESYSTLLNFVNLIYSSADHVRT